LASCRYDVRQYSFSNRITNIPYEIISAPAVNRFWAEQKVFYNYKANITGYKGINL